MPPHHRTPLPWWRRRAPNSNGRWRSSARAIPKRPSGSWLSAPQRSGSHAPVFTSYSRDRSTTTKRSRPFGSGGSRLRQKMKKVSNLDLYPCAVRTDGDPRTTSKRFPRGPGRAHLLPRPHGDVAACRLAGARLPDPHHGHGHVRALDHRVGRCPLCGRRSDISLAQLQQKQIPSTAVSASCRRSLYFPHRSRHVRSGAIVPFPDAQKQSHASS